MGRHQEGTASSADVLSIYEHGSVSVDDKANLCAESMMRKSAVVTSDAVSLIASASTAHKAAAETTTRAT